MQTLLTYNDKLEATLNILSIKKLYKFVRTLTLSVHLLFLNKNLNFVSTPKRYGKKQLDTDVKKFFSLTQLRGYQAHLTISKPRLTHPIDQTFQMKGKTKKREENPPHHKCIYRLGINEIKKPKKKKRGRKMQNPTYPK